LGTKIIFPFEDLIFAFYNAYLYCIRKYFLSTIVLNIGLPELKSFTI